MSGLSLYTIEDSLAEVLASREELRSELERPTKVRTLEERQELQDELAMVEKTLAEYTTLEVGKVDNYHRFISAATATAKAARQEAILTSERARRLEDGVAWLKRRTCELMAQFGKKRVDGTAGRAIIRKGNGGLVPLQIDGWDADSRAWTIPAERRVLPNEMADTTFAVQSSNWLKICDALMSAGVDPQDIVVVKVEPNPGRIRSFLGEACPVCEGSGMDVARAMELSAQGYKGDAPVCATCNGSKKQVLPGARLLDRGEHVELK